jgi:hypothetical protein
MFNKERDIFMTRKPLTKPQVAFLGPTELYAARPRKAFAGLTKLTNESCSWGELTSHYVLAHRPYSQSLPVSILYTHW